MSRFTLLILSLNLTVIVLGIVASSYFSSSDHDKKTDDIYYLWQEGKRIASGENPYSRILADGEYKDQDKGYAIYFPLFYILSAFTQLIGFKDFPSWISVWQPILLACNLAVALLLLNTLYFRKKIFLAILAALFWLFNRYTLHGYQAAYMDFLPLFFLILSLVILPKAKWLALYVFSLSLALKQLAIFLLPLYLIWVWQASGKHKIKTTLLATCIIVSLPLLVSLPFVFWDARGLAVSLLNSVYRGTYYFGTISLDAQLHLSGWLAKAPMFSLMGLVYFAALKKEVSLYTGAFLVMLSFVDFSSVLFIQHLCWVIPLAFLAVGNFYKTLAREN